MSRATTPFVASIELVLSAARRKRIRVALVGGFALGFHGVLRATANVDFLVDTRGADALDAALVAAGAACQHRSADAASYATGRSGLAPVTFIFARRARAEEILARRAWRYLRNAKIRVPVVDAEGLIGLKLQALANQPDRVQHANDIEALVAAQTKPLKLRLLRDYYRLFERLPELDELLSRRPRRRPPRAKSRRTPVVGSGARARETSPPRARDVDEAPDVPRQWTKLFGVKKRPHPIATASDFRL